MSEAEFLEIRRRKLEDIEAAGGDAFPRGYDVDAPVNTICMGMAASAGSFLLAAGENGRRAALPHARIMLHQPSSGTQGTAADIEIAAKEILYLRDKLNELYAEHTGQDAEKIKGDLDRDLYMSAPEAKEYGIIDKVIQQRSELEVEKPS